MVLSDVCFVAVLRGGCVGRLVLLWLRSCALDVVSEFAINTDLENLGGVYTFRESPTCGEFSNGNTILQATVFESINHFGESIEAYISQ